jgi:ferredoxin-NADP reductase
VSEVLALRVCSVRRETPTTRIVRLDLDGRRLDFRAGQSVTLGVPGRPERKPYSIACAPEDVRRDGILEFLAKVDTAGEGGPHVADLRRGDIVSVEGPFGSFTIPDRPGERRFLFVAGGTGIAPIRAMVRHLVTARQPARLRLCCSARQPKELAYRRELRRLARAGALELIETVTRDAGARWRGGRGRIDLARLAPLVDDPATLCFICGPASLVDEVPRLLHALGVAPARIRIEEW